MGIGVAIRIQVGMRQIGNLCSGASCIVQQRLDIIAIDKTIAVEVTAGQVIGRHQLYTIDQPCHVGLKRCSRGI